MDRISMHHNGTEENRDEKTVQKHSEKVGMNDKTSTRLRQTCKFFSVYRYLSRFPRNGSAGFRSDKVKFRHLSRVMDWQSQIVHLLVPEFDFFLPQKVMSSLEELSSSAQSSMGKFCHLKAKNCSPTWLLCAINRLLLWRGDDAAIGQCDLSHFAATAFVADVSVSPTIQGPNQHLLLALASLLRAVHQFTCSPFRKGIIMAYFLAKVIGSKDRNITFAGIPIVGPVSRSNESFQQYFVPTPGEHHGSKPRLYIVSLWTVQAMRTWRWMEGETLRPACWWVSLPAGRCRRSSGDEATSGGIARSIEPMAL